MDYLVLTREQARLGSRQRIAVKTRKGEYAVVTVAVPAKVRNRAKLRLREEDLQRIVTGGHRWPPEQVLRVRVPDWRLRNGLTALFVVAGLVAGAGRYSAVLAGVWGAVAFCARYRRRHRVDEFDPETARRFWPMFRGALARTTPLYLIPAGAAIALYLCAALVIGRVQGVLTVQQLLSVQSALSSASAFFDKWIKLGDGPLFLVVLGVYLLTCLLLARRGRPGEARRTGAAGPAWRIRHGMAVVLHRAAEVYGRYTGPVAVALATLASFTFLVSIAAPVGTQLRLRAVDSTRDYRYAAQKITEELDARVVALLNARIQAAMPAAYLRVLPERPFQHQAERIREQAGMLPAPLSRSNPRAARVLAAEEARIRRKLPGQWVVSAPHEADPVTVSADLTAGQAAAARDWARSSPADDRVELIGDSGREVVLQAGNVLTGPYWDKVRELVKHRFPLAGPMVDALSEAFSEQLQHTIDQKVQPLVRQVTRNIGNAKASILNSAKEIVATVKVQKLVHDHAAAAKRLAAGRRATLADLRNSARQLQRQASIIEGLAINEFGVGFDANLPEVLRSGPSLQRGIVDDLMAMIHASRKNLLRMQQAYNVEGDPIVLKHNAAHAIQHLAPDLPGVISADELAVADANCGCP